MGCHNFASLLKAYHKTILLTNQSVSTNLKSLIEIFKLKEEGFPHRLGVFLQIYEHLRTKLIGGDHNE